MFFITTEVRSLLHQTPQARVKTVVQYCISMYAKRIMYDLGK